MTPIVPDRLDTRTQKTVRADQHFDKASRHGVTDGGPLPYPFGHHRRQEPSLNLTAKSMPDIHPDRLGCTVQAAAPAHAEGVPVRSFHPGRDAESPPVSTAAVTQRVVFLFLSCAVTSSGVHPRNE